MNAETTLVIKQMPIFKKAYKKLQTHERAILSTILAALIKNPQIGEVKKGGLAGVYVYKFTMAHQTLLLAYTWDPVKKMLLALDVFQVCKPKATVGI